MLFRIWLTIKERLKMCQIMKKDKELTKLVNKVIIKTKEITVLIGVTKDIKDIDKNKIKNRLILNIEDIREALDIEEKAVSNLKM